MSKQQDGAIKEVAEKRALVPKLRFPEFQGSSSWQIRALGQACHMQAGKFVPAAEIHDKYMQGLFPCYGGNGLRGYTATFTHNGKYSLIGRQGALCGNIKQGIGQFHATEHAIVVTPKNGTTGDWLFFVLDLMNLNRLATGQAQPGLSVDVLEKLPIAVPNEEAEQQKIADCLSSLDELIAAQARKVDALKTHKKGLMQQLFPREGETQPRLRFPEFRDAGEWAPKTLEEIADIKSGSTPLRSNDEFFVGGTIPWVKTTDLNNSFITETEEQITPKAKARVNPVGSVLVAMYGGFNQIGRTGCLGVAAATNQAISVLQLNHEIALPAYVLAWLNAKVEDWKRIASSSRKDPNITGSDVAKFPIALPGIPEQICIADCLTSLDDLITTATQALETLKTHKKGLMQQLFPSAQEAEA